MLFRFGMKSALPSMPPAPAGPAREGGQGKGRGAFVGGGDAGGMLQGVPAARGRRGAPVAAATCGGGGASAGAAGGASGNGPFPPPRRVTPCSPLPPRFTANRPLRANFVWANVHSRPQEPGGGGGGWSATGPGRSRRLWFPAKTSRGTSPRAVFRPRYAAHITGAAQEGLPSCAPADNREGREGLVGTEGGGLEQESGRRSLCRNPRDRQHAATRNALDPP